MDIPIKTLPSAGDNAAFGTTAYKAGRSATEVSQKRYRYVAKELDNETGLFYYGMRYYAVWIAKFISVDPLAADYLYYTPFQYAGNKPISFIDLDGAEEDEPVTAKRAISRVAQRSREIPSRYFEEKYSQGIHFAARDGHIESSLVWQSFINEVEQMEKQY